MKKTRLGSYFDGIVSAHDLGLPKEDVRFWGKLREKVPYDPVRTLLGEDSEINLGTAAAYGIRHLIYVSRFSSAITPVPSERYASIHYFTELISTEGTMTAIKGQRDF
jgi:putative hydrolase of the HAD superfamily